MPINKEIALKIFTLWNFSHMWLCVCFDCFSIINIFGWNIKGVGLVVGKFGQRWKKLADNSFFLVKITEKKKICFKITINSTQIYFSSVKPKNPAKNLSSNIFATLCYIFTTLFSVWREHCSRFFVLGSYCY